ncbi:MAG TPA: hypothetical protein VK459_08035, partial [Polyangiaceae bacterium]|nr:hypothetical protein [Polyangiaceae bacterium]
VTITDTSKPQTPGASHAAKRVILGIAAVAVVTGAATIRVILAGEREIAQSTAALRAGNPHEAAVHARRAAGWYAPGAPHVRVAYDRLIALATAAEGLGNREIALLAWNGVRTAAIETKWIVQPHAEDLERANRAIARISAATPLPLGANAEPAPVLERKYLETLARDESPRTGWIAALVVAFAAWIGGAVHLARRALTPSGRVLWGKALPGIVTIALGALLWILAYWRA